MNLSKEALATLASGMQALEEGFEHLPATGAVLGNAGVFDPLANHESRNVLQE